MKAIYVLQDILTVLKDIREYLKPSIAPKAKFEPLVDFDRMSKCHTCGEYRAIYIYTYKSSKNAPYTISERQWCRTCEKEKVIVNELA